MPDILFSALCGCAVGVAGTGAGGLIGIMLKTSKRSRRRDGMLLGFSAGVMLSMTAFELLPESIRLGGVGFALAGALLGAAFTLIMGAAASARAHGMKRLGLMLITGIAIHNLPEGLAVGAGLMAPGSFGVGLCAMMLLHDMPEGLAVTLPLREGGMGRLKALLICAASGLPSMAGAVAGAVIGGISPAFISASIAFAGGAMLILTVKELLPECCGMSGLLRAGLAALTGFAAGAVLAITV